VKDRHLKDATAREAALLERFPGAPTVVTFAKVPVAAD